jgi:hypothetical protein
MYPSSANSESKDSASINEQNRPRSKAISPTKTGSGQLVKGFYPIQCVNLVYTDLFLSKLRKGLLDVLRSQCENVHPPPNGNKILRESDVMLREGFDGIVVLHCHTWQ